MATRTTLTTALDAPIQQAQTSAQAEPAPGHSNKEPYVQVDPKKVASYELGLAATDNYHTCYHKLRPHIAYMLELLRLNKPWVPQDTVDQFEEVFQVWLTGIEKKKTGGAVRELATKRGHTETTALFDRYLALRRSIEDESKTRPVLPPPPPTISLLSTVGNVTAPTSSSSQAGPSKPRQEIPEIQPAA